MQGLFFFLKRQKRFLKEENDQDAGVRNELSTGTTALSSFSTQLKIIASVKAADLGVAKDKTAENQLVACCQGEEEEEEVFFFSHVPLFRNLELHATDPQSCSVCQAPAEIKRRKKIFLSEWLVEGGGVGGLVRLPRLEAKKKRGSLTQR
jgi:hypothetical protein